jgi:hypothetical protein
MNLAARVVERESRIERTDMRNKALQALASAALLSLNVS